MTTARPAAVLLSAVAVLILQSSAASSGSPDRQEATSVLLSQNLGAAAYSASSTAPATTPAAAFDGDFSRRWNANSSPPQWIEVDLQSPYDIDRMLLRYSQVVPGDAEAIHEIWVSDAPIRSSRSGATRVHTFSEVITEGQVLQVSWAVPLTARYVQVLTTLTATGAAWYEVQIFGFESDRWLVGLGRGGGEVQTWALSASALTAGSAVPMPWSDYNAFNGEVHPAMGDVDGDGYDELLVGLGVGGQGWIAIFDDARRGFALVRWIQLPWPSYNASNGTIWPAAGDIDGDGRAEIIAGLGRGGQGYFAVFGDAVEDYALRTWRQVPWPWYNAEHGETRPAVANIDGGLFSEIVIGLGPGGMGWLQLVDGVDAGFEHLRWMRVGWGTYIDGPGETYPAAGDIDGDGYDEIVVGLGPGGEGWLQVFDDAYEGLRHRNWLRVSWSTYAGAVGETHPAVGNIDADPAAEVLLGLGAYPGDGGWFEVLDDGLRSFAPLGWGNAAASDFRAAGGATFPAAKRPR